MQITNRLFIRYRGNAGVIYRCSFDQRNQRQAMDRIGLVHLKTREVKTVAGAQITPDEHAEITAWVEQRIGQDRADRDVDLRKLNDHMNLTTQWFLDHATDEDTLRYCEDLLLSVIDLRNTLIRRRAQTQERLDAPAAKTPS